MSKYCEFCGAVLVPTSDSRCAICHNKQGEPIEYPISHDKNKTKYNKNTTIYKENNYQTMKSGAKKCNTCGAIYPSDMTFCPSCIRIKSQPEIKHETQSRGKAILEQRSNVPKCPTCGSTNVEKISLASKAIGGALFGLFSSNVRNTMHCKNCGYKW